MERGGKCLTVEKFLVRVPVRLERQSLSKTRIKTIEGHQEMFGREESQRGSAGEREYEMRGKGKPKSKYRLCCHNAPCPAAAAATPPARCLIIWLARRVCRCRSWSRIWSDKDAIKCEQVCDMPRQTFDQILHFTTHSTDCWRTLLARPNWQFV